MNRVFFLLISLSLLPWSAYAAPNDVRKLDSAEFTLPNKEVLDFTLEDVVGILEKYQPKGAKITNRTLIKSGPKNAPRISFDATKRFAFFSRTTTLRGDVTSKKVVCEPPSQANGFKPINGYDLTMDLRSSHEDIRANANELRIHLCYTENPDKSVKVKMSQFIMEGPDFGKIMGPAIEEMLKDQTRPLIQALITQSKVYEAVVLAASVQKPAEPLEAPKPEACKN